MRCEIKKWALFQDSSLSSGWKTHNIQEQLQPVPCGYYDGLLPEVDFDHYLYENRLRNIGLYLNYIRRYTFFNIYVTDRTMILYIRLPCIGWSGLQFPKSGQRPFPLLWSWVWKSSNRDSDYCDALWIRVVLSQLITGQHGSHWIHFGKQYHVSCVGFT